MPEQRYVEVRRTGTTCIVTLRREEKLNALSSQVERELRAAIESEEAHQSRCLVITGGARAFSAGADVGEMRGMDPASILAYYRDTGDVYERIAALPQPTISAISGYCLGGGLELALATDFRIADESSVLGLPEVNIGIVPSSGGIHRLVRMVGTARDALAAGLVTEVVAEEAALPRALEIAAELAALPPLAIEVAKQSIDRGSESSREAALAIERLAYGLLAQSEDAREAMAAFMEKRTPRFQGR